MNFIVVVFVVDDRTFSHLFYHWCRLFLLVEWWNFFFLYNFRPFSVAFYWKVSMSSVFGLLVLISVLLVEYKPLNWLFNQPFGDGRLVSNCLTLLLTITVCPIVCVLLCRMWFWLLCPVFHLNGNNINIHFVQPAAPSSPLHSDLNIDLNMFNENSFGFFWPQQIAVFDSRLCDQGGQFHFYLRACSSNIWSVILGSQQGLAFFLAICTCVDLYVKVVWRALL